MAWRVRLPDGSLSEPFDTRAEADVFAEETGQHDDRTPEEIYDATTAPRVGRAVFLRRMAMGWKLHRALHTTPDGRYLGITGVGGHRRERLTEQLGGRDATVHEVLGRTRTLQQWAVSCGRTVDQLRHGIDKYGTLQGYFLNTGWYPSKPATPEDPEITDDVWKQKP